MDKLILCGSWLVSEWT